LAKLYLHEELLLLALRDREGTLDWKAGWMAYGLGGALLTELVLAGRVRLVAEKKKTYVEVVDSTSLGNTEIDEALAKIAARKKRDYAVNWIARLAGLKKLWHRTALGLCRQGILRADEKQLLLVFRRKVYPEVDPRPEKALVERIRKAVTADSGSPDARTAALVGLANAANMLPLLFDRKTLKARKARLKQITEEQKISGVVGQAVAATQAAIMTTVIMTSAASAAS
jgi:golgi phosphoprotein 3